MNLRTLSSASIALLNVVLFIAIILSGLYLAERHYSRFDLTSNKAYTLSPGTIDLLRNLQDVLHIKVYMSKDLPPEFTGPSRDITDTFEEFASVGGRKVSLRFIDPTDDEQLKSELNTMGILELRAQIRNKERLESKNIFFSAAFFYRNRKEIIRNLYEISDVELTSVQSIMKVANERIPKIAYVTSNKTLEMNEQISTLYKELLHTFNIAKVDLEKGEDIPNDADVLFVAGPKEKLSSWALYCIDKYLVSGGKVVMLVDRVQLNSTSTGADIQKVDSDIETLLAHYGVKVNQDVVCDFAKMGFLRYNYGGQVLAARYPMFVGIDKVSMTKYSSPITSGLQVLYFPWTSSLEFDTDKLSANTVTHLAVSSDQSTVQTGTFEIDPQRLRQIGDKKERIIASLITGKFKSYFDGKPKPTRPASSDAPPKPDTDAAETPESPSDGFLAVVASSYFASDSGAGMFGQTANNLQFMQNVFEYIAHGNALIGIRMKKVALQKVIEENLNKSKASLWLFNIALMPIVILLAAFIFKIISFLRKKRYEEMVGR